MGRPTGRRPGKRCCCRATHQAEHLHGDRGRVELDSGFQQSYSDTNIMAGPVHVWRSSHDTCCVRFDEVIEGTGALTEMCGRPSKSRCRCRFCLSSHRCCRCGLRSCRCTLAGDAGCWNNGCCPRRGRRRRRQWCRWRQERGAVTQAGAHKAALCVGKAERRVIGGVVRPPAAGPPACGNPLHLPHPPSKPDQPSNIVRMSFIN